MTTFTQVIQPMRHDLGNRLPLFLWNVPLPRDSTLVKMRQNGALRRAIDQMAERGIVPTVQMGWEWTSDGAMAMAQTLREAGRPVYLLIPDPQLVERGAYSDTSVWMVSGPDASSGNRERRWPCLPLADPRPGAARVRGLVQPFKDGGIDVSGVWFDDEALPHPWNGVYEAQKGSPICRAHYPPGALADWPAFQRYVFGLRTDLQSSIMADAVHAIFPSARVGNYHDSASSAAVPFVDEGGNSYPPRSLGRLDVLMPSAYANTLHLARQARGQPLTQESADRFYFVLLLRTVSTANANKLPGQVSVPFLCRSVRDDPAPTARLGMSQQAYRELLRHVLLRGADGLYLFNLGYPGSSVTPVESFESVEDARTVYDELLAHRDFLDRGRPMTYAVPAPDSLPVIWSGSCLPDQCLVRAVTLGLQTGQVMLEPFPGIRVTLDAPSAGATYLVHRDGRVLRS